ncbi:MAG: OmpL47-type beta-barrel domain-containing protein, partial [Gemmobacter sp.]
DLSAVGLVAVGPEQVEPVTIGFDYFRIDAGAGEEDTTAPTTELTLDPAEADGENGWYVSAPTLTLSADDGDGSGVAITEYRLGDGDWTAYDEPVVLEDGDHEVSYRSTDQAGNVEETGTTEVLVDTVAPETSAEAVEEEAQTVITLTAVDATSGVALTEVAVGDGDWTAYDEPLVVDAPGVSVVAFRSTDEAGLVEETQSVEVEIDPGEV